MQIYLDSAKLEYITKSKEFIDGVTTNPTLLAKENNSDKSILTLLKELSEELGTKKLHVELDILSKERAKHLRKEINSNVVLKIPITEEGLQLISILRNIWREPDVRYINTNATLCFTALQALLAAKAGADYVSPFVGRLDDIGNNGMQLIKEIKTIYTNYNFKTKIIVASIRNVRQVLDAALVGADIVTVPYEILCKLIKHSLTDKGIEIFNNDFKKINY